MASPITRAAFRTVLCPVKPPPPRAGGGGAGLSYSLTVPGEPRSAGLARAVVRSVLDAHGLRSFIVPVELAVSELVGIAVRLSPGEDLYLSLRRRAGEGGTADADALRIVLWDRHPRHRDPDAESVCVARRRRALWLLAAVVDDWGGEWGFGDAQPPHRGKRSWVVLPR